MTADNDGCLSFLDLFERMKEHDETSARTICITPPTFQILRAPGNHEGYAKWKAPKRLKIVYVNDTISEHLWHIEEVVESRVLLSVGEAYLDKLKQGMHDIMQGEGDYAIGINEESKNSVKMRL